MSHWANGKYEIQNSAKYVGNGIPRYRSGWELSFMRFCDNNDHILQWASESIAIPYRNPITVHSRLLSKLSHQRQYHACRIDRNQTQEAKCS